MRRFSALVYGWRVKHVEEPLLKNLEAFVAFTRKRVGDPELAQDLVQDSLLKALQAERKPSENEDVIAWFYRILRRSIIDLYRRNDVRKRALERFEAELPAEPDADAERFVCDCVQRLIPDLPAQYQELVRRIDLNGEDVKDVAGALRISPNNLTVRLHRARKQLREKLEQVCRVCSEHGCLDCDCDGVEAC